MKPTKEKTKRAFKLGLVSVVIGIFGSILVLIIAIFTRKKKNDKIKSGKGKVG